MVDSHAHLGLCEPDDAELVAAAGEAGVRRILTVGIDEESSRDAIDATGAHEGVFACAGRHPNGTMTFNAEAAATIETLCRRPEVVAVGETGLDYYRDNAPGEAQAAAFAAHVEIARSVELPLVIHMRDSAQDSFELLEERAAGVEVILHCFSEGLPWAERAAANGWYVSFAGNLTYPKAEEIREAAAFVPSDRVLVETDSPFLAPQVVRGKPNQPANVVSTAERLAELRGVAYEELERAVEENAARVFGW
ncbi:MAG: TatD family deoxyribonuclease [Solirubrobacterales bacterium]|nr:TatD family deoxyribonuclease [Solirubrobacterales bacterium]